MPLTAKRIRELCLLAIAEAKKSVAEDARAHPLVGAILADSEGNVLASAHRGETIKRHAEFTLLERAQSQGIDTEGCNLFVTLEPCIHRGPDKTPCAIRVVGARIRRVFIGNLDPDPRISGRGELHLIYQRVAVERFPADLAEELRAINKAFYDRFRAAHFWDPPPKSLYGATPNTSERKPQAANSREGILYQSLDLMTASNGPIWISAGDLSWLRELQVALIGASLDGREVRLLQQPKLGKPDLTGVAAALGTSVVQSAYPGRKRFMLVEPNSKSAAAVVIERSKALLLRNPDEAGLLELLQEWFELTWSASSASAPEKVHLREIPLDEVIEALRSHVARYRNLSIELAEVAIDEVRPATHALELFKLFRVNQFAALSARHQLPGCFEVVGSPWPMVRYPLIERLPSGALILIDGTHRAFAARARGESLLHALLIENPNYDLPSQPAPDWASVDVRPRKLSRDERYINYDETLFRPIRAAYESLVMTRPSFGQRAV